jgi:acyl-CoA synthetase (AMP-forming)/AMP-acid ligase II
VPDTIRDKHGILTAEERGIMQQHPLLGLDLLDSGELSPLTKVTIAQHHERYDGSGYPRGLSGDDIHDHGQIAAVAEAYVAGRPDDDTGEAVHAWVVAAHGQVPDATALRARVAQALGPLAVPRTVALLGHVPVAPSGKPDKSALVVPVVTA